MSVAKIEIFFFKRLAMPIALPPKRDPFAMTGTMNLTQFLKHKILSENKKIPVIIYF